MSILAKVTRGKIPQPVLAIIYGPDGVGKSSFGADAPKALFLGPEQGTSFLDVARLPSPSNFKQIIEAISELRTENHDFKTLVIDSLDWIEPLVWQAVCDENNADNIEKVGGGYGKGYLFANQKWQQMRDALKSLREAKGMHVVLIAHSQIKAFQDPASNTAYDRYQLKLNEKAAAMWREFVDSVLFATFEVHTKTDSSAKKAKAYGDGSRVIFTERRPSHDAKNRLGLPFKMALSWNDFFQFSCAERPIDDVKTNIQELLKDLQDQSLKDRVVKAVEEAGGNTQKLLNIENKLRTIVGG